ncbi:MAG: cytochrome c-type biogenesis protein CcmH [Gammaproteobacteria bacterium]|nr:cytochrome c-type biogenesis protein CcmH [Gammaproteobacteria bacterium]
MCRCFVIVLLTLVFVVFSSAPFSKEATSMAEDPAMEKTVNEISSELRCLVCQNQTIADSHAELAVDLKNQVRDMVREGQSQDEIVDYMVQRYGDFVRYRPAMKPSTILLWAGPFLLLLIGLTVLIVNLRKRSKMVADDAPLSDDESDRLNSLLHAEDKNKKMKESHS